MTQHRRAVSTLAVVAALAVPLAIASIAFACARLATIKLDRKGGTAGTEVTVLGRNFNNDAKSSPVAIRFNSRRGAVLAETRADRRGRFLTTFEIPKARAGWYVIVATQETAEGRPAAGTPGRSALKVRTTSRKSRKARRSSRSGAEAVLPPVGGGGSGGGGLPAESLALAPLLLLLGGGGAAALVLRGRRSGRTLTSGRPS